jgi:hypothetical protein
MVIGSTLPWIQPELSILFEAVDRPRIWILVVEVADLICHPKACGTLFFRVAH